MLTRKQKLVYLVDSILSYGQEMKCTYCGSKDCVEIDRKYLITRLMECRNCHLYFRYPVDKKEANAEFYQTEYIEQDKITTDLPDMPSLKLMMNDGFKNSNKNADRFLRLFSALFPGEKSLRIIDYGCSWGYQTYQFRKAGHQVQGYEISRVRAAYGINNLDLEIKTEENALAGNNQIFFSSHVIEHHPDISSMTRLAKTLLIEGGYFIAVSPNGSSAFRQNHQEAFHHAWGKVHPNYLSGEFYKYIFRNYSYYVGSNPFNTQQIHPLQTHEKMIDDLSGEELLVIAKID